LGPVTSYGLVHGANFPTQWRRPREGRRGGRRWGCSRSCPPTTCSDQPPFGGGGGGRANVLARWVIRRAGRPRPRILTCQEGMDRCTPVVISSAQCPSGHNFSLFLCLSDSSRLSLLSSFSLVPRVSSHSLYPFLVVFSLVRRLAQRRGRFRFLSEKRPCSKKVT
jgi:hypothetical protein